MYGRAEAGISSTTATHQPPATTIARVPYSSWSQRRPQPVGAVNRYTRAKAGSTRNACRVLVRNARPNITPTNTSQRVEAVSVARTVPYAASVSSSTSSASGLLKRNISAATGVSASAAPATRPPSAENRRRTVAYTAATVPTPISTCGASTLNELRPRSRAESAIGHSESGGLSTVMKFAASEDPKNIAFQLTLPACTAAE